MTTINRRNVFKLMGAAAGVGLAGTALAHDSHDNSPHRRKFVLIHGAWHNGSAWNGVADLLRAAGHEVEAPTLPGMNPGDNQAGIQFIDYVDAVVDILQRQHRKVICVGHSSAGQLMQAAIPDAADAVELAVFNNAFILANGQNQLDNIPPDAAAGLTALAEGTGIVPFQPLEGFIRGALMEGDAPAVQDAILRILVPQPFSLFSGRVDTRPFEVLKIRKAVLLNLRDHSADYCGMATRLGNYQVVTANGSHEMLFAEPVPYTAALLKLVGHTQKPA